jgi:pilus assembly protein Flp/PilA
MLNLSIRSLRSLYSFPRGQGLVEYALILVLVAIIVIIMLALFGGAVGNMYSNVIANL